MSDTTEVRPAGVPPTMPTPPARSKRLKLGTFGKVIVAVVVFVMVAIVAVGVYESVMITKAARDANNTGTTPVTAVSTQPVAPVAGAVVPSTVAVQPVGPVVLPSDPAIDQSIALAPAPDTTGIVPPLPLKPSAKDDLNGWTLWLAQVRDSAFEHNSPTTANRGLAQAIYDHWALSPHTAAYQFGMFSLNNFAILNPGDQTASVVSTTAINADQFKATYTVTSVKFGVTSIQIRAVWIPEEGQYRVATYTPTRQN